MKSTFLLGIILGMIAALMLNIGKGVQKQKVHVFLQGRKMFSAEHRGNLGIWLLGLFLTAGAAVPFSLGLKFSESPSTISAMTGIGLIGLAVYAMTVIGERASIQDAVGITLVVVGTSIIAYLGHDRVAGLREFEDKKLILTIVPVLVLAAAACWTALKIRRIHGVIFGATAGFCLGLVLFLADAALLRANGSVLGQFSNPYPYAAIAFAVLTTFVTQIGFLRGRALEVVPALNSAAILTPLLFEMTIYGVYPHGFMPVLIMIILAGVILVSRGAAARVAV